MMILELSALILAAAFSGAAIYISLVEHPARLSLATPALLQQWKPSYRRGFAMQSSLALIAALLGFAIFIIEGNAYWFAGGCLMLANWPYTLVFLMALNKKLLAQGIETADETTRQDILKWEKLHRIRIALGLLGLLCYVLALL